MRSVVGLWRWRHNPLRRATDLVEAWLALVTLLIVVLGAPLAGTATGVAADGALQRAVRHQRTDRHPVAATVVRTLGQDPARSDPESSTARGVRTRVLAHWRSPGGTPRHGVVATGLASPHPGSRFRLWTDRHGHPVGRPLDHATATTHAVLAGFGAAVLTAGCVECGRRLILWQLVRRRYACWDRAWDKAGPDWGKAGTGS
ncbi:hypothetical protein ACGFS9_04365 [Streptomyces sp. NPDC048566]|uniref:Rv1733c family protein n=1 Tax=Streptomyces sp. NPDC048566 TaxID=3365569 RepID=UPI0037113879